MKGIAGFSYLITSICGALLAIYSVIIILFWLLGYETVRFRGSELDADPRTAALLAVVAIVFLGISRLIARFRARSDVNPR